jgi:hypothetical protein
MQLFDEIKAAGIPFKNHGTDLYLPDTPNVRAILDKYPLEKGNAKRFQNRVEGGIWIDVPFAYLPEWDEKIAKAQRRAKIMAS